MGCEGNETRKRGESEPHVRRASKSPSVTGLAYNRRSSPASHDFAVFAPLRDRLQTHYKFYSANCPDAI